MRRVTLRALESLDAAEREAVTARLRPRRYSARQVVFNDGDIADCMHVVVAGRFIVEATTPAGVTIALRVVHPGEFFGELALVRDGHRRTGRVVALESAETATLNRLDFETLRRARPGVDRLLVTALVERMVAMSDLALELVMPVEDRIWRRIAVLVDAYGDDRIKMTQDHLAHIAGAARQTVNRVLRQAEADGVVELTRGGLRVIDADAIKRRAGQ